MKFSTNSMTEIMERHATRLGLKAVRAFVAEDGNGVKEYVIYQGDKPIYANSSAEAVGAHLDMIWLAECKAK